MHTDGSHRIKLTEEVGWNFDPAWAPDGQQFVFVANRYPSNQLLIMDLQTLAVRPLKSNAITTEGEERSDDYDPSWSPDGQWIAYTSSTARGETDIYKIRVDGTGQAQLTHHTAPDEQPTWSPDGSQIAFVSWRVDDSWASYSMPEEKNIFIMNADGSNLHRLTDDRETENLYPQWSPDGQWLAYASVNERSSLTTTLYLHNLHTLERQQVLQTAYPHKPGWSPDGKWLVFTERLMQFNRYGRICFVQITGENYQCLDNQGRHNANAKWQPYLQLQ